jgi:hypothetical protein
LTCDMLKIWENSVSGEQVRLSLSYSNRKAGGM